MGISSGMAAFKLQFAISPIILTGGIASQVPGNAIPFLSISSGINFAGGLLTNGGGAPSLDDYFAIFQAEPGGSLISQDIGKYPFANQQTAGNAVIQKPLNISMLMICPAGNGGGYSSKFANMQSIQQTLYNHNVSGGMYTVMTSAFPYVNGVMLDMIDISSSLTKQQQNTYRLDFEFPLLTQQQAENAQNALMSKISSAVPTSSISGPGLLSGNPSGAVGPQFVPSGGGGLGIPGSGGPSGELSGFGSST